VKVISEQSTGQREKRSESWEVKKRVRGRVPRSLGERDWLKETRFWWERFRMVSEN